MSSAMTGRHLATLERELRAIFAAKSRQAAVSGPWLEYLWNVAASTALGGKLIRPRLFLSAMEALTPEQHPVAPKEQIRLAAALELLHYSFLLHDDVIDGDLLRRGRPNLIAHLADPGARPAADSAGAAPASEQTTEHRLHWGRSCAILMGSLLLSETHQIFAALELPPAARSRALALLDHAVSDSVLGEQLDVGLSDRVISGELSTILQMCARKTGTYTFALPLRAAAAIAEAEPALDPILGQAGRFLGLAFQLQDDLLSAFGDPARHGKDAYSDLRHGKETALIAYARMTSSWTRIERGFGSPGLSDDEGDRMRALLVECGARDFVEHLIAEQIRSLEELLRENRALVPDRLAALLRELSRDLDGRVS